MIIRCANCGTANEVEGKAGDSTKCSCGNQLTMPDKEPKDQFGVVHCTNCWKRYGVVGRPAGTRFKCKSCNQVITIKQGGAAKTGDTGLKLHRVGEAGPTRAASSRETTATAEFEIPGEGGKQAPPERQQSDDSGALRATTQKYKAALEESEQKLAGVRMELDEKSRLLGEREAEFNRQVEEGRTLQERNMRQAAEIGALEQEMAVRAEESTQLKSQKEDIEKLLKIRDDDVTARDARIKQLEAELAERPSRDETKKFHEDKVGIEKRLDEGGSKLSAMKEALAVLRAPLADCLKKFDELGGESGKISLPDFTAEFAKAKKDAEEHRLAFSTIKKELDAEKHTSHLLKHQKDDLTTELERTRKELASARKASEDVMRAAEEEIEQLAASSATAEQRKGFLRSLFGGKSTPAPVRPSASSSRFKLRAEKAIAPCLDEAAADDGATKPTHDDARAPADEAAPIAIEEAKAAVSDADTLPAPEEAPKETDEAVEVVEVVGAEDAEGAEAEDADGAEDAPATDDRKAEANKRRGRLRRR